MSCSSRVRRTNSSCLSMTACPCWSAAYTCVDAGSTAYRLTEPAPRRQSLSIVLPGRYKATVSLLAVGWPGPPPGGIRACCGAAYSERVTRLRIALAQANSTVGDLSGNAAAVLEWTRRAAVAGADLVVFPEMMLTGYPVEDLALRASFVSASIATLEDTARRLADAGLGGIAVVTGYLGRQEGLAARVGVPAGAPLDAAALLYGGRVVVTSAKHHLPNYGVFDEYRYFVPGNCLPVVRVPAAGGGAVDVAIAICEDLWQDGGPVAVTRQAGAGLLVVPNASPYERGKSEARFQLVARRAREAGAALAYVNMMGGQDELVFDGDSIIVDAAGELLARGPQFEETLLVADLELPAAAGPLPSDSPADARDGTTMTITREELSGPARGPARRPTRAAGLGPARPAGRGVRRAGHRDPRLRAEERLPLGDPRPVRRDRFRAGGHHRRRCARPGAGARGADAQQVLLRALGRRRRGPGQAAGAASQNRADRADGGQFRGRARPGRAGRREPAVPGPRGDPDGAEQRRRAPRPDHG